MPFICSEHLKHLPVSQGVLQAKKDAKLSVTNTTTMYSRLIKSVDQSPTGLVEQSAIAGYLIS